METVGLHVYEYNDSVYEKIYLFIFINFAYCDNKQLPMKIMIFR